MKVKVRMMYKPGGVAEIGRAGTDLRKENDVATKIVHS